MQAPMLSSSKCCLLHSSRLQCSAFLSAAPQRPSLNACLPCLLRVADAQHEHKSTVAWASTAAAATNDAAADKPSTSNRSSSSGSAIYGNPELYEAAFSYRDIKQEAKFLLSTYKRHAVPSGSAPQAILDLGCGPCSHGITMAAMSPVHVVGLDLSQDMVRYAQRKAQANNRIKGSVTVVQGDLTRFEPPVVSIPAGSTTGVPSSTSSSASGASSSSSTTSTTSAGSGFGGTTIGGPGGYSMVMCLLGTFTHVLNNMDALTAFSSAAAALQPGGLFIVELTHPGDLFDGTLIMDGGKEMWEVPRGEGRRMMVEWGSEFDEFDPVTQVLERTVAINVLQGDEVIESIEEVVVARQYTVQEVELLARCAGLEIVTLFGDMAQGVDLSHEEAYRMVAVLRKGSSGTGTTGIPSGSTSKACG